MCLGSLTSIMLWRLTHVAAESRNSSLFIHLCYSTIWVKNTLFTTLQLTDIEAAPLFAYYKQCCCERHLKRSICVDIGFISHFSTISFLVLHSAHTRHFSQCGLEVVEADLISLVWISRGKHSLNITRCDVMRVGCFSGMFFSTVKKIPSIPS